MKTISKLIIGLVLMTAISVHAMAQETLPEMIERGLSVSRSQSKIMAKSLENNNEAFPKTFEKGKLVTCDYRWWVSGFFPGVLWQLYSDNGDNELRRYAELYTNRAEPVKKMTDTHDLGFMLYAVSAGAITLQEILIILTLSRREATISSPVSILVLVSSNRGNQAQSGNIP